MKNTDIDDRSKIHTSFLVDNVRRELNLTEGATDYLTAQLIHSVFFHEEILYLDAFLVNNPYLLKAAQKYPIIYDIFDFSGTKIALMEGNSSLLDNFNYLHKAKVHHHDFPDFKSFELGRPFIEKIDRNSTKIPYNFLTFRNYYTDTIQEAFTSHHLIELLNRKCFNIDPGPITEQAMKDLFDEMIMEKYNEQGDKTINQADMQLANRNKCPFFSKMDSYFPGLNISGLQTILNDYEQQIYRRARAHPLPGNLICNPDMRNIEYKLSSVEKMEEKRFTVKSEWFHTANLLYLDGDKIAKIRESDAFKNYLFHLKQCKNIDPSNGFDAIISIAKEYLEEYVKYLNMVVRNSVPIEKQKRVDSNMLVIDVLSKSASFFEKISQQHNLETMHAIVDPISIGFQIVDGLTSEPGSFSISAAADQFICSGSDLI